MDKPGFLQKRSLTLPFLRHRAEEETAGLPPLMATAERAATSVLTGDHRQRKVGTGEKFWQFRDYDPSDRPQDIDWRQSAKGDHVFVRQKEWQTTQIGSFWCASYDGMKYSSSNNLPSKYESAITLGLGLSILMVRAGELVSLLESGMQPGRTDSAIMKIGQGFMGPQDEALPDIKGLKIPNHAGLILIGDFLSLPETIRDTFSFLAARATNALVIQVLDPAELDLPFSGRVIFEDKVGADKKYQIARVESVRAEYKTRIAGHLSEVHKICRDLQWEYLLHTTDTPVRDTLFKAWALIDRGQK